MTYEQDYSQNRNKHPRKDTEEYRNPGCDPKGING